jgi:hypothetical protein
MLQRFRKTFCSRIPLMESPEIQPLYNWNKTLLPDEFIQVVEYMTDTNKTGFA